METADDLRQFTFDHPMPADLSTVDLDQLLCLAPAFSLPDVDLVDGEPAPGHWRRGVQYTVEGQDTFSLGEKVCHRGRTLCFSRELLRPCSMCFQMFSPRISSRFTDSARILYQQH